MYRYMYTAPQGNERGARGSKSPPLQIRTLVLFCSARFLEPWFRSKTPFSPMPLPRWALLKSKMQTCTLGAYSPLGAFSE